MRWPQPSLLPSASRAPIAAAGLIAVPTTTPPAPAVQAREIRLTDSADSLLGDGTALVIGGSGIPIPAERYVGSR